MARVVGVHGIGQEFLGPHTLLARGWSAPLNDGLALAGASPLHDGELTCAFYGNLFRPPGSKSVQVPPYEAVDVEEGLERELLLAWWQYAADTDPEVPATTGTEKGGRTPRIVQQALDGLCRSRYFGKYTPRLLISGLKQVASYLKVSSRQGLRSWSRQLRATVLWLTPSSTASSRVDQCVTPSRSGGGLSVAARISAWRSLRTVWGRPGRGLSAKPSSPVWA
jgi:hypothetical protein